MSVLHDAVRSVYSNAVIIFGNDVDSLKVLDNSENEIEIDAAAVTNAIPAAQEKRDALLQSIQTTKQSALDKLAKLGLTEDEINALIG